MPVTTQSPIQNANSFSPGVAPGLPQAPREQAEEDSQLRPHNLSGPLSPQKGLAQWQQLCGQPRRLSDPITHTEGRTPQMDGSANDQEVEVDNTGPQGNTQPAATDQPSVLFNRSGDPPNLAYHGPSLIPFRQPLPNGVVAARTTYAPPQSQSPYQHPRKFLAYIDPQTSPAFDYFFQGPSYCSMTVPRTEYTRIRSIFGLSRHGTRTYSDGTVKVLFCWGQCCEGLCGYIGMFGPRIVEER